MPFYDDPNDLKNKVTKDAGIATSLVGKAIGIAPMIVGAGIGINRIMSNQSLSMSNLNTGIRGANVQVGNNLRRLQETQLRATQKRAEQLRESLISGGEIRRMLQESAETRKQVIGATLELLDSSDATEASLKGTVKEQLLELMDKEIAGAIEEEEKLVSNIMNTILETGSDDTKRQASRLFQQLDTYSNVLSGPPNINLKGLSPNYNPISYNDLNDATKSGLNRLRAAIGEGADSRIRLYSLQEATGQGIYARVFRNAQQANRGLAGTGFISVPLQMADAVQGGTKGLGKIGVFRGGQGTTTYVTPQIFADAAGVAEKTIRLNKPLTQAMIAEEMRKGSKGVFFDAVEAGLRTFETLSAKHGAANIKPKHFHSALTDLSTQMSRAERVGGVMGAHMQSNLALNNAQIMFTNAQNLTMNEQRTMRAALAAGSKGLLDASGDPMVNLLANDSAYFSLSLGQGGSLSAVRPIGGVMDRTLLPVVAREKQILGRKGMFVNNPLNPVGSTFGVGNVVQQFGQNLEFADGVVSGGMQKAVVLDVGDVARFGLGEGEAYMGSRGAGPLVANEFTKTVVDPTVFGHKKMSTQLLNELVERRQRGMRLQIGGGQSTTILTGINKGKTIGSVDEFFAAFGGKKGGVGLLGFGENMAEIGVQRWAGMKSLDIGLSEVTDAAGKQLLHFSGSYTVESPHAKVFGMLFKGTVKGINENVMNRFGNMRIGNRSATQLLAQANIGQSNLMLTEGSMLKKAPAFLANQMIGGASLIAGADPRKLRDTINLNIEKGLKSTNFFEADAMTRQRLFIEESTRGTARALAKSGKAIPDELIGMVFAGAWKSMSGLGKEGEDAFAGILEGEFGKGQASRIMAASRQGLALGLTTLTPGPQSAEYRRNLASMEPRTYQFLQHRLQNMMGLPTDTVSDFMTSVIARKAGTDRELKVMEGLTRMTSSIAGNTKLLEQSRYEKLEKVAYDEFIKHGDTEESMKAFLRQDRFKGGGGFMLDFGPSGSSTRIAAQNAFGHGGGFFVAGGDVIDLMKGTEIPGREGNIKIEAEYIRRVTRFANDIALVSQTGAMSAEAGAKAQQAVGSFKNDMAEIWATGFKNLLRGKLRGSAMAVGQSISLGGMTTGMLSGVEVSEEGKALLQDYRSGVNKTIGSQAVASWEYNAEQLARARGAVSHVKGRAAFAETETFLSAMNEFISGEKASIQAISPDAPSPRAAAAKDAGEIFRRFFIGMEGGTAGFLGSDALAMRHPQLGPGHIAPAAIFRHAAEVGYGSDDATFKAFARTAEGVQALEDLQKHTKRKISSFADIANLDQKGNRRSISRFFTSMAENITSYSSGEGGGRLLFPSMEVGVHYGQLGAARRLDLSMAAGMIGDFDGDLYQLMFPGRKMRKSFHQMSEQVIEQDLIHRTQTRIMVEESKQGIKNLGKMLSTGEGLSAARFVYEDAIKERIAKDVGRFDVALDQLRIGIVNTTAGAEKIAMHQQALALLTAVEEVGIKAKKLPRGIEITRAGEEALKTFISSAGQKAEPLETFIKSYVFGGTELAKGATTIHGVDVSGIADAATRRKIGASLSGMRLDLQGSFDVMRTAAVTAKDIGIEGTKTVRRLSSLAQMDTGQKLRLWNSAVYEAGAVQGAFLQGEQTSLSKLSSHLHKGSQMIQKASNAFSSTKMVGPLALGAAASLGLGALLGDSGYSPTPLIQPGEFSDARVQASIMSGTATDRHIPPDSLPVGRESEMMNRPINIGTARVSKDNAYMMRGEIVNRNSMYDIMGVLSRTGSNGSIIINDTRRPITKQYIDRVSGE
tara:strand:- start:17258 stop:22648 length:5391 start_codon:yes stop_codon:yes gene_type:complete